MRTARSQDIFDGCRQITRALTLNRPSALTYQLFQTTIGEELYSKALDRESDLLALERFDVAGVQ